MEIREGSLCFTFEDGVSAIKFDDVLFLEGDFDSQKISSRSKTMIMKRLQDSINKKLSWLNCRVSVVDSDTYNERYFKVEKITA